MGSPNSRALVKRSADDALAPALPAPKRQKRPTKVLDEERYSDALSHIIARDFFPGLLETEAQSQYLEALDSRDNGWIRDAGRKLTTVMTPGPTSRLRRGTSFTPRRRFSASETPRDFVGHIPTGTPVAGMRGDFAPEEEKNLVDVHMSLGAFQARYTNEDNESFNALLDRQNERRLAKYAFLHNGNKILAPRQIAHRERERKLLEGSRQDTSTALIATNAAGEERRVYAPGRVGENLDARPASVDSFPDRHGPRNAFMFDPEGVEDFVQTKAVEAAERSNAPPKATNYAATRLRQVVATEANVPASPSMSAIDAAIAGRPKPTSSEAGYTGAETPRINGYAFVDAEPSPSELGVPVTDEEADAAEREAAIKLLPKAEEGQPNPFTIHQRSKREDLHHRLVDSNDQKRRKGGRLEQLRTLGVTSGSPGRTPTPKFASSPAVSKKSGAMTTAAQNLVSKLATPRRHDDIFDGGVGRNKTTWSPASMSRW